MSFSNENNKGTLKIYIKSIIRTTLSERKKVTKTLPQIYYHGTSSKNIQSILSKGMKANPESKVWNSDKDIGSVENRSLESLEGSYWTKNFMTAYSSAGSATTYKSADYRAIVIASISPKETLPDEDNIAYSTETIVLNAIRKAFGGNLSGGALIKLLPSMMKDDLMLDNMVAKVDFSKLAQKEPEFENLKKDLVKAYVERAFSHILQADKYRYFFVNEYHFENSDSTNEDDEKAYQEQKQKYANTSFYEKQYSDILNKIAKSFRATRLSGSSEHNVRYTKDLGYTSRSKILAVITVRSDLYNNVISVAYRNNQFSGEANEVIQQFMNDYRANVGTEYKVE